ncbi:RNA polymerase sigma factor [Anatilimnocola floriformis]|uniref:RNA polymerase sigma factor n=1 Tax=Anatilimnocola floriformis TaxID=2948575 RepID=UPI0020C3563B|nr:sigma-70 family RNA polymerase sigma factor [Anatilimnocola floriformis]
MNLPAIGTAPALDQITTRWSQICDPLRFVMRYSQAIRAYLKAIFRDDDAAEEACQEFLAKFLERGLDAAAPDRGRFRDYLKISVRNTAVAILRRKHERLIDPSDLESLATDSADDAWVSEWQRVILDKAWRLLEQHERSSPQGLHFTVLKLTVDHGQETSEQLAARASQLAQREINAVAFRKQLSRARQHFAQLIVEEVSQTLSSDVRRDLGEELAELGLLPYVKGQMNDESI